MQYQTIEIAATQGFPPFTDDQGVNHPGRPEVPPAIPTAPEGFELAGWEWRDEDTALAHFREIQPLPPDPIYEAHLAEIEAQKQEAEANPPPAP